MLIAESLYYILVIIYIYIIIMLSVAICLYVLSKITIDCLDTINRFLLLTSKHASH